MKYEYTCRDCEHVFEGFASVARRDEPQTCPSCGSQQSQRTQIPKDSGTTVRADGGYEMAAVMKNGETVKGHFGKVAPKKSVWGYR